MIHETHTALHTLFDCLVQRHTEKTVFPRLTPIPGLPGCVTPCLEAEPSLYSPHNYNLSLAGGLGHTTVAFGQSSWKGCERQCQPPALLENVETGPDL